MIKVIACDMDGTLLGANSVLEDRTIRAINAANDKGIRVILATGRTYGGLLPVISGGMGNNINTYDKPKILTDYILCNGAEVRNSKGEVIFDIPLDFDTARRIYEYINTKVESIRFYTSDCDVMIGDKDEIYEVLKRQLHIFMPSLSEEEFEASDYFKNRLANTKIVKSFDEMVERGFPIYKMFVYSGDKSVFPPLKAEIKEREDVVLVSSFATNVEITDPHATKGLVLKRYIEGLGISMEETAVFGDSENDISMLEMNFGMTFAMENGSDDAKAAAKFIAPKNTECGVAIEIEKILHM